MVPWLPKMHLWRRSTTAILVLELQPWTWERVTDSRCRPGDHLSDLFHFELPMSQDGERSGFLEPEGSTEGA